MKLLLITAVAAYTKEVKHILKIAQVKAYSYKEVIGCSDVSENAIESNWFGTERNENESVLFYAFVPIENVATVFDAVKEFNATQETLSHIHVAVIKIEKSN